MMHAISNGGKSARSISSEADLLAGEFPWPDFIPGNPYSELDTGLIVENGSVRAKTILEMQREFAIARMNLACGQSIIAGFLSSALGTPHTYPSDRDSQANLQGQVARSQIIPSAAPFRFMCMDSGGVWARREHSADQIVQVGEALGEWVISRLDRRDAKLIEIAASSNPDSVSWDG